MDLRELGIGQRLLDPVSTSWAALLSRIARSSVATALRYWEKKGLVARNCAAVLIIDRKGRDERSNGTYAPPEI
jgi:hypothetical protein